MTDRPKFNVGEEVRIKSIEDIFEPYRGQKVKVVDNQSVEYTGCPYNVSFINGPVDGRVTTYASEEHLERISPSRYSSAIEHAWDDIWD